MNNMMNENPSNNNYMTFTHESTGSAGKKSKKKGKKKKGKKNAAPRKSDTMNSGN